MLRRISIFGFIVALSSAAFSQATELRDLQKGLEKKLFKHTPHVRLARFSGCILKMRAEVRPDGKENPMNGQMPSSTPRDAIFNTSVDLNATKNIVEFEIDLTEVSSSSVVLKSTADTRYNNISLEAEKLGAVSRVWQGKRQNVGGLDILVNQKESAAIADSFRQVIKLCRK